MSIAQEIQRIQNAKANIKTAIENKGITVGDGTIDTYAEKIGEISGGGSGIDLGKLCNQIKFSGLSVFGKSEVILDLDNTTSLNDMFYLGTNDSMLKNTIVEHITLNCKKHITDIYRAFYCYYTNDDTLKHITLNADISKVDSFNNVFVGCRTLETIDGTPFDFTNTKQINTPFRNCSALKELRVKPNTIKVNFGIQYSPNLSTDTIQSIIDGLADLSGEEQYIIVSTQNGPDTYAYPEEEVIIPREEIVSVELKNGFTMDDGAPVYTVVYHESLVSVFAYKKVTGGGTTQTLTLHSTVGNKLTDTQKATITAKNWELVY